MPIAMKQNVNNDQQNICPLKCSKSEHKAETFKFNMAQSRLRDRRLKGERKKIFLTDACKAREV